jgi:hypothetical protein
VPIIMSVGRHLTAEDLLRLQTEPAPKVAAPTIQRLKAWHHTAARLVASGQAISQVAIAVGYTKQRISDLTIDPTFAALVESYRDSIAETGIDDAQRVQTKLLDASEAAMDEINRRLEEPDELKAIPVGELRQIATMGLDRTVAPPKAAPPALQPPIKVTFKMGVRELRPETETEETKMIDITAPPVPSAPDNES